MKLSARYIKVLKTAALYSAFFALGLCLAIPGPTLLDLQKNVQVDTSQITYIYLARSSSCLLGSLIGGIVFDFVKRKEILLIFASLFMSITAVITPWCRSLASLIGVWALGGIFMGAVDTGGNVICLHLWGKESAPYLQGLHFLFGVGAFAAPLIAAPFLEKSSSDVDDNNTDVLENTTSTFEMFSASNINCSLLNNANYCTVHTMPPVAYPYTIIGVYVFLVAIFYVILSILFPQEEVRVEASESQATVKRSLAFTVGVIVVAQLTLAVYCGMELGYGQMLTTFAVKGDLKLSKTTGSFLTALFWGTFTFGRGVSIGLAAKFSPITLIIGDLAAIMVSCTILLVFGNTHEEALWAGTFLLALGLASFFPSTLSWLERYIDVNNRVASVFVVSASLGEMIVPLAVGHFMESQPRMLLYIVLGCGIAGGMFSFLLWFITSRKGEKYRADKSKNEPSTNTEDHKF